MAGASLSTAAGDVTDGRPNTRRKIGGKEKLTVSRRSGGGGRKRRRITHTGQMSSMAIAARDVLPTLPLIRTAASQAPTHVFDGAGAGSESVALPVPGKGKAEEDVEAGGQDQAEDPTTPTSEGSRLWVPAECSPAPRKPAWAPEATPPAAKVAQLLRRRVEQRGHDRGDDLDIGLERNGKLEKNRQTAPSNQLLAPHSPWPVIGEERRGDAAAGTLEAWTSPARRRLIGGPP
ncbi:hypothetical protein SETIT_6G201600v2 [Setaria italica]|uniref:Uncharacterized protein n=1 Tax=Setaria italica TaxID=4555 RepID=A0A368RQ76_SETIT|nr:hypothetical protein SETIT_6G201600v2 [Setaria italica]